MASQGFDYNLILPPEYAGSDSRFLDYFNYLGGQIPVQAQEFMDPNDPDYQRYQQLSTAPTGSEQLIRDYVSRAPSYEDYNPSLGRKIAAFLVGALSGRGAAGGYNLAREHLYAPFERDVRDWTREGKNIASRASLMDKERARQLAALKFNLQNKAREKRFESTQTARAEAERRRIAAAIAGEEERREKQANLEEQREWRRTYAEGNRDLTRELALEREARAEESAKMRRERFEAEKKEQGLKDYAIREGIDATQKPEDIAMDLAYLLASRNPAFSDIIDRDEEGIWEFIDSDDVEMGNMETRRKAAMMYINRLAAKLLRGDF